MDQFVLVNSILLWLVVLFNLLLTFALIRRTNNAGLPAMMTDMLKTGQRAPAFSAESLRGETLTLASYANRSVAFVFAAPHCASCREEVPKLEVLWSKARLAGVELVMVLDASTTEAQALVDEFHLTLPVVVASRAANQFMTDYKVGGTPFYCLVDANGKVEATGYLDGVWQEYVKEWEIHTVQSAGQKPVVSLAQTDGG